MKPLGSKHEFSGSNALKKPFTKKMSEEDKKIAYHRLSLRISPLGKDIAKLGIQSPEYVPQP